MRLYSTTGPGRKKAEAALRAIELRQSVANPRVQQQVRRIVQAVQRRGDAAVRMYAEKLDGLAKDASLKIDASEMAAAWQQLPQAEQAALTLAAQRIRAFAQKQKPRAWQSRDSSGMTLGQVVRPLDAVACYVPAGRYPLPSTLLMTAIPAQVARVARVVVLCPRPSPMILAAAHLLKVAEFYRIGGAHGIAAAACGTASLPRVDKICGPGNAFVTAAKQFIASDPATRCSIDMAAGPTETLIASDAGDAEAIAADLCSQAEHDPAALAWFVTTRRELAQQVLTAVKRQARGNTIASQSLADSGAVFVVSTKQEMADTVNRIAPEHLTVDSEADLAWVRNAGSIFVGTQTPQALGDYISGPNHTLPTAGLARQRGGLSVTDFAKTITVQSACTAALRRLAGPAAVIADAEGLRAHAASLRRATEVAR
jgi:histidinol dehydrogenase